MELQIYRYIVDDIRNKINGGTFLANEKLPTEIELMDLYDTSQSTVRKALNILCNEGYIHAVQRIGYYVNEPKIDEYTLTFDDLSSIKNADQIKVISSETKQTSEISEISAHLAAGRKVLEIKRLITSSGIPAAVDIQGIIHTKDIKKSDYESSNLFDILTKKISIFQMEKEITISACLSDEYISGLLYIPVDEPLIKIDQMYWDKYHKLIAYSITYYISHFIQLSAESV